MPNKNEVEVKKQNEVELQAEHDTLPNFEKVLDMVGDLVTVGRKVYLDGKVNLEDTQYVQPLLEKVPEYVKIDFNAAFEEIKKPSILKIISIVRLAGEKYKQYKEVV